MTFSRRDKEKFWGYVDKETSAAAGGKDCWLWTGGNRKRTGHCAVLLEGGTFAAHRVSAAMADMDIAGKLVCHKCDVAACVNPDHLYPGTFEQNNADTVNRRRHRTTVPQSVVDAVRSEYRFGVTGRGQDALAKKYGLGAAYVQRIVRNQTRKTRNPGPEASLKSSGRPFLALLAHSVEDLVTA